MAEIKNLSKLDAFSALSKIHILTKRDEKKEQNHISKLLFSLVLPDFFYFLFYFWYQDKCGFSLVQ